MDLVTRTRVDALLDQVENDMFAIEGCSKDIDQAVKSHIHRATEMRKDFIETDDSLWTQLSMEFSEIIERAAVEKEKEQRLRQTMAKKKQTQVNLTQQVEDMDEEVRKIRKDTKDEMEQAMRLQEIIKVEQHRIFSREASIEQRERRQAKKAQAEQQIIDLFQTILGLRVEPVEDQSLQFTYTCIDENDPDAQFQVTVASTDGQCFQPVRCVPMISEFDRLSAALRNKRVGLPGFVRDMRQGFVRHAASQGRR